MKQFLAVLLAATALLGLAACKPGDGAGQKPAGGHYDQ